MTSVAPLPVRSAPALPSSFAHLLQEMIDKRQILLCDAIRILGATDRAEDVVQEAMLRCLDRSDPPRIDRPTQFARRMVRNLAIDRLRRERHLVTGTQEEPATSIDNPEARLAGRQALRQLDARLRDCPPRDRELFLRHRLLGEPQNRLAAEFGLSTARVNAIIARLHSQLAPLRPEPVPE
ncbi:sigma-70 family RNA polymerase sigma factor [uncultured Gemmobacter sp.]|uniref:sigma-70 family RNA polymerase sigma factor n=1 Tax=uncultured Gemmobacter sp. TaxID=1095917 RepID=UPI000AEE6450|nr:sigma-70 family RNA polymerase sigma factor [uncultured Gemmobacter sp.]